MWSGATAYAAADLSNHAENAAAITHVDIAGNAVVNRARKAKTGIDYQRPAAGGDFGGRAVEDASEFVQAAAVVPGIEERRACNRKTAASSNRSRLPETRCSLCRTCQPVASRPTHARDVVVRSSRGVGTDSLPAHPFQNAEEAATGSAINERDFRAVDGKDRRGQ